MNDAQANIYLGLPASTLGWLLDDLNNAIYVIERGRVSHIS
jgi:hypothetical protein